MTVLPVFNKYDQKVGVVVLQNHGWVYIPHYQARPSRKGHGTPKDAIKNRRERLFLEPPLAVELSDK